MDRRLSYLGAIPGDLDFNQPQQFAMVSDGNIVQATMGASTWVDGLALSATAPAGLSLLVGPGRMGAVMVVDQTNAGTAAIADSTDALMKMGVNLTSTTLTFTPPPTAGQSQVFLIQGQVQETDTGSTTIQYWNAANPSIPLAGPGGSGASQNTLRVQRVAIQTVAGAPANTGSQTVPTATTGWTPLYTVTLANGQTTITTWAIHPAAPFVGMKLPTIGTSIQTLAAASGQTFNGTDPTQLLSAVQALRGFTTNVRFFVSSQTYTPSPRLFLAFVEIQAPGGGGGAAPSGGGGIGTAGGGGGGGGYVSGWFSPSVIGAAQALTIGAAGSAGLVGTNPTAGGSCAFGGYFSATGGAPGQNASANSTGAGGVGGGIVVAAGPMLVRGKQGKHGAAGYHSQVAGESGLGGYGGDAEMGFGGAYGYATDAPGGRAPDGQDLGGGGAGAGSTNTTVSGGNGAPGAVRIIEYIWNL